MSHQLTRQGAYFLRRSAHGREVVFQFLTRKELVVALAKQYKAVVGDDQRIKIFISSADSSCLSVFRTLSVQVSHSKFGAVRAVRTDLCIEFEAFGPTGKPLNIRGLLESSSLHESKSPRARRGGIYCGYGPVPNIHRPRLGRRYFRNIATTQEKRLNHPLHLDMAEPLARPYRRSQNLPSAWDDIPFARRSKGWKEQRKVRKSWDR